MPLDTYHLLQFLEEFSLHYDLLVCLTSLVISDKFSVLTQRLFSLKRLCQILRMILEKRSHLILWLVIIFIWVFEGLEGDFETYLEVSCGYFWISTHESQLGCSASVGNLQCNQFIACIISLALTISFRK